MVTPSPHEQMALLSLEGRSAVTASAPGTSRHRNSQHLQRHVQRRTLDAHEVKPVLLCALLCSLPLGRLGTQAGNTRQSERVSEIIAAYNTLTHSMISFPRRAHTDSVIVTDCSDNSAFSNKLRNVSGTNPQCKSLPSDPEPNMFLVLSDSRSP
jgi:hypothetical protein